jgi:hypothetical protein
MFCGEGVVKISLPSSQKQKPKKGDNSTSNTLGRHFITARPDDLETVDFRNLRNVGLVSISLWWWLLLLPLFSPCNNLAPSSHTLDGLLAVTCRYELDAWGDVVNISRHFLGDMVSA